MAKALQTIFTGRITEDQEFPATRFRTIIHGPVLRKALDAVTPLRDYRLRPERGSFLR